MEEEDGDDENILVETRGEPEKETIVGDEPEVDDEDFEDNFFSADDYVASFSHPPGDEFGGIHGAAALPEVEEEDVDIEVPEDGNIVVEEVHNPIEGGDVQPGNEYAFLHNFIYDQHRPPKKKDILYYFDIDNNDWSRVQIISKSNFRHYFNFKYLDEDRPNNGIYFKPGDFWSHSRPVPREDHQHVGLGDVIHDPVEVERGDSDRFQRMSRRLSPLLSRSDLSRMRTDRVLVLPEDNLTEQLSPKTKKRARRLHLPPEQEFMRSAMAKSLAPLPGSATPQSRISNFLDKVLLGKK